MRKRCPAQVVSVMSLPHSACVCIYYLPQIIQLCLAMQRLMLDSNLSQSTREVTVDRDIITKINTTEQRTCLTGGNKVMLKNTIIQVYISVDLRESIKEIVSPRKFVNYVLELLSCGSVMSLWRMCQFYGQCQILDPGLSIWPWILCIERTTVDRRHSIDELYIYILISRRKISRIVTVLFSKALLPFF